MTKNYWPHSAVITVALGCALLLTAIEGCECCCRKHAGNGERGGTSGITGTTGASGGITGTTGAAGATGICELVHIASPSSGSSLLPRVVIWKCKQGTCSGKCVLQAKSLSSYAPGWSDVKGGVITDNGVVEYKLTLRCNCVAP